MNDKQYLIICFLNEIIKNVDKKFTVAEFDRGYRPFDQTDAVVNHIDLAVITPENETLVCSWFDKVFCQSPCLIEPLGSNAIENIINAWGKKRAEGHVLLLGNDLTDYATEDMPCIVLRQRSESPGDYCFYIDDGWKSFTLMLQNHSIMEGMSSGQDVASIILDAVDNADLRQ